MSSNEDNKRVEKAITANEQRNTPYTKEQFRELSDHLHEGVAVDGEFLGQKWPDIAADPYPNDGYIHCKVYIHMILDALDIAAGNCKGPQ